MDRRNSVLPEEDNAVSASLGDALIFTTMSIIGLPVNVHVKNGSVYSGIFHTACVEDGYAVVLKRARMIKKGTCDANVDDRGVIQTLIILSDDLVQVVAKGVQLPADGNIRNLDSYDRGAVAGIFSPLECPGEVEKINHWESNVDRKHIIQPRYSSQVENGLVHGFIPKTASHSRKGREVKNEKSDGAELSKIEEDFSLPVKGRQTGDGRLQWKQNNDKDKSYFEREETAHDVPSSSSILDEDTSSALPNGAPCNSPAPYMVKLNDQSDERHTSADIQCSSAVSSGAQIAVSSSVDVTSESCPSSSSGPSVMIPPKSSSSKTTAKEFKLNPGAKIFSPSFAHHGSVAPPAVPSVASMAYIPDNCPILPVATTQPEVEISAYAPHSSLPVKFVPYGNLVAGNGGCETLYRQPIGGHLGSRTQPVRYAGQYHSVQGGPTYAFPTSQNVTVGRLGPLVYLHPVSHDVLHGVPAFSQASTRPLLTPPQIHLSKHQGSAAPQALQLCVAPTLIANGQQPFAVPSHIPLSQPPFPVICPISVPGSNGCLASKF